MAPPRVREGPDAGAPELDGLVEVGRIVGAYGVHGWVRVVSYCVEPDAPLQYSPWLVRIGGHWVERQVEEGRRHGKGVVARLEGCGERDRAQALAGTAVAVRRAQLPEPGEGEYYWADLIGCAVENVDGRALGRLEGLIETGANDVLVVRGERERLVPYLPGQVVREVDLRAKRIRVDWDPDF